jgi:hypothetical protein
VLDRHVGRGVIGLASCSSVLTGGFDCGERVDGGQCTRGVGVYRSH